MNYKGNVNNTDLRVQQIQLQLAGLAERLKDGEVLKISTKRATLTRWGMLIGAGFQPVAAMLCMERKE